MEILGIDIGGSGIKGAPVNILTGEITQERFRIPTPPPARPSQVAEVVQQLVKHFNWKGPIGCGFPAVVRRGTALTAANIDKDWIGTSINQLFTEATRCPTEAVNDADAAGMAEMAFGAGKDWQKGVVIMTTIGTGIGTAIFVDGVLLPNTELGHIEIGGKDAERRASDAARQRKNLSWDEWGERLNEYYQTLDALFWPDLFIIGGGVSKKFSALVPFLHLKAAVVPATLLNDAGIVGAAMAAARAGLTAASTAAGKTALG